VAVRKDSQGPFDVLDHATSAIASNSKLGFDATRNCRAKDYDHLDGYGGEGEGGKFFGLPLGFAAVA